MSSFLLKITLRGTPNLIWRRFVVPSFMTLPRLHETVQTVMGWQGKRSHAFFLQRQAYVPAEDSPVDGLPEEMFSLDDLLYRTGAKLRYVYDPVEARWTHDLVVESTRYLNSNWSGPVYCLEGIRACPPESCDGPAGFTELLKGLKNPRHPDHAEWDRRFGSVDFDAFEIDRVNKALKARRSSGEKDPAVILEGPTPKTPLDPLYRLGLALKNKAAS